MTKKDQNRKRKELVKSIRAGLRLDAPPRLVHKDKSKYNRKRKHKQSYL